MSNSKTECYVTECTHVSIEKDVMCIYPSYADKIISISNVKIIGKTLDEIMEHTLFSDDFRVCIQCSELLSKEDILAIWKHDCNLYLFRFKNKSIWRYHITMHLNYEYEATSLEHITNNTANLFHMMRLENLSYDSIINAYEDHPTHFIKLGGN